MFLIGTLAVLVAFRIVFLITYPLNNLGGDTSIYYYEMMLERRSNLVFAPGYPFLIGFVPSILSPILSTSASSMAAVVLWTQHAIDLAVCLAVFWAIHRIYGPWTASFAVLIYGLSPFNLSVTSAAYPEWLQGNLLALTLVLGYVVLCSKSSARYHLGYLGMILAATWCTLTKFNAAPFVTLAVLVVFVVDPVRLARKARAVGLALLLAAVSTGAFIWTYHYPTTGTLALSRDRSWVLMAKIASTFGNDALTRYRTGVAARRWLALGTVLPPRYDLAHPFAHVAEPGTAEIRASYRPEYKRIRAMTDDELKAFLSHRRLPDTFSLGVSSVPVSVFVGLRESDEMGIAVFREFVSSNARAFTESVLRDSWQSLRSSPAFPLVPLRDSLAAFHVAARSERGWGFRLYAGLPSAPKFHGAIYVHGERARVREDGAYSFVLWEPGVTLFSWMGRWRDMLLPPSWILMMVVATVSCLRIWLDRGSRPNALVALGLILLVTGVVLLSNAVLAYRWKEARFVAWPSALIVSLSATWAIPWLVGRLHGALNPSARASRPGGSARTVIAIMWTERRASRGGVTLLPRHPPSDRATRPEIGEWSD